MITKKKLIKYINNICMYCLMAMGTGFIVGSFLVVINMFWKLVF